METWIFLKSQWWINLCYLCVSLRKDILWWNLRELLRHINWRIIAVKDHEEKADFLSWLQMWESSQCLDIVTDRVCCHCCEWWLLWSEGLGLLICQARTGSWQFCSHNVKKLKRCLVKIWKRKTTFVCHKRKDAKTNVKEHRGCDFQAETNIF